MTSRRQELSQRRKAVGFTQESLAAHLGVERSTVIRWEAGDSEPLPSIRPSLARALEVSIDQLAELLTRSEVAGTTRTWSADPEGTIPALPPDVAPLGPSDEAESGNLIRPQIAETVEALRRALHSAGVSAEDLAAMLLVGGSPPAPPTPEVAEPPHLGPPSTPAGSTVPPEVQSRGDRSRKRQRLMAAGAFALALPAAWLSAPFLMSHGGAVTHVGTPVAPVAAIPAPSPGSGHDSGLRSAEPLGEVHATPPMAPGGPVQPTAAGEPAAQTISATHSSRNASRSTSSGTPAPIRSDPASMIANSGVGHRWDGINQVSQFNDLW
ncbi:MAG: helix-turn-helix domain-containing protein [Pseudonocardiaceae bacterium]